MMTSHVWTCGLLALCMTTASCATVISKEWSQEDRARVDARFEKCDRYEEDNLLGMDCGLYLYEAWFEPANTDHAEVVAKRVAAELEEPFTGHLGDNKQLEPAEWDGVAVSRSIVTFVTPPETIIQPAAKVFVSQAVGDRVQFFSCWHTLTMATSAEDVAQRIAVCYSGLKTLALATR